jgi:3-deoxy-D-manno-octulosonate 8-phosphate phosphatase KdsC-like HAD superfamily phosphatase
MFKKEGIRKPEILFFSNFKEAIETLKERLTEKDLLILDIDGVLLDIDIKILVKGLLYAFISKEMFKQFIKEHSIPISYILTIRRLAKKGIKIALFTSRFVSPTKNYFPFVPEKLVKKFEEEGINFITQFKLSSGINERLLNLVQNSERIFYIGSGILDFKAFNTIKSKFPDKEFLYIEIGKGKIL